MPKWIMALTLVLAASLAIGGCKKKDAGQLSSTQLDTLSIDDPVGGDMPPLDFIEPEPIRAEPAPAVSGTYVVQKGDTLWSIARRTYGDGQRWREIAEVNSISDPAKLRVGQTLAMP